MNNPFVGNSFFSSSRPAWLPVWMLGLNLYGVLVLHWSLQPIVYLFWLEMILILVSAVVKTLLAMDGKAFMDTLVLKIFLLLGGVIMGIFLVAFSVVFTFGTFKDGIDFGQIQSATNSRNLMVLGYFMQLMLHFFANSAYQKANPIFEMVFPLVRVLMILAFLQVFTMHLIPKYGNDATQAIWIVVALMVVKFVVEMIFEQVIQPFLSLVQQDLLNENLNKN